MVADYVLDFEQLHRLQEIRGKSDAQSKYARNARFFFIKACIELVKELDADERVSFEAYVENVKREKNVQFWIDTHNSKYSVESRWRAWTAIEARKGR
jgi:hypothetical protein